MTHHDIGVIVFGLVLVSLMVWAVISSMAATVVVRVVR